MQAGSSSDADEKLECKLAGSYSTLKVLVSIFQLLAATYTLWLHRGDQVSRWGFASFYFMPIPYAIMSLVNGISHLFTTDYPALYMVSSSAMQEAVEAGGTFCGVVGHVEDEKSDDSDTGYGSGFDSNWQGLTPGVLRRTVSSIYHQARGTKKETRDVIISEKRLPEFLRSDNATTWTNTNSETIGSPSAGERIKLPLLFVVQSRPLFAGESYIIRALHRNDNPIESEGYVLPKVNLKWVLYGLAGIGVLFGVIVLHMVFHPIKTCGSLKRRILALKTRVQTFLEKTPDSQNNGSSIVAIRESIDKQPFIWVLFKQSSADLEFDEQLYRDTLPRISFRACERFRCQGDSNEHHESSHDVESGDDPSSRTTNYRIRGFIAQACLVVSISGLSLLIIGLMSGFKAGRSSKIEQVIFMMWLAVGIVVGFIVPFLNVSDAFTLLIRVPLEVPTAAGSQAIISNPIGSYTMAQMTVMMFIPWSIFVPPIWGFVIVGKQLQEWGTCVSVY